MILGFLYLVWIVTKQEHSNWYMKILKINFVKINKNTEIIKAWIYFLRFLNVFITKDQKLLDRVD